MSLYKFVDFETAKKIVLTKTLKFSNPAEFNDPFDCSFHRLEFNPDYSNDEFAAFVVQFKIKYGSLFPEEPKKADLLRAIKLREKVLLERAKICCFSLINDHPLLWSHYAFRHTGACLVFDENLDEPLGQLTEKMEFTGPVSYSDFIKLNYCAGISDALINMYMVKGLDWKYEQEFRLVSFKLKEELIEFTPAFLKGIIFGLRVSDNQIVRFLEEVGSAAPSDIMIVLRANESLRVTKWIKMPNLKGLKVHALTTDPDLEGFYERLFKNAYDGQ